jgi:outer membrane protein assembly factor BamB
VEGGVVYIGSINGSVYALNAVTGEELWSFQTENPIYASPTVVGNIVYINTDNGTVYALRTTDGTEIWQAYIGSGSDHADDSPAVAYGIVYVGTRNGYYAFNATTGQQIWFFTSPYSPRQLTGYVYSSPAVTGDTVYFGSYDSYVFALNAFNGSLIWAYQTGGFLFSSPAVSNGALYIGSYDGNVYALGNYTSTITASPTLQPNPTTSPTATPTPSPAPTSTQAPATTAQNDASIYIPVPTSVPSQAPAPFSTVQPEPTASSSCPTINLILLSAILAVLGAFFAVVVLAFRKQPS